MNEQEKKMLQQIRIVPGEKNLAAIKKVREKFAQEKFEAENAARKASNARLEPVHEQMRQAFQKNPAFAGVNEAIMQLRKKREIHVLPKPFIPIAPKVARLKIGSFHLVDVPPFLTGTWQAANIGGGDSTPYPPLSNADPDGNLSFSMTAGQSGSGASNDSGISCYAAVGQTFVVPPNSGKEDTNGVSMIFSAFPSFNWQAVWGSDWWRQASGNIWIGQFVDKYNENWSYVDSPVSTQQSLCSWNDNNLADSQDRGGANTSFGMSSAVFVQSNFFYNCGVWMGASVSADESDSGWSISFATMNANVNSLMFDAY